MEGDPEEEQDDARGDTRVTEDALPPFASTSGERSCGNEDPREKPSPDARPGLRPVEGLSAEDRPDRKGEGGDRCDEEPRAEEQVEAPPLDREADPRQEGDDDPGEGDGGLDDEPQLRQAPMGLKVPVCQEEAERGPEQAEEEDLAPEVRLEHLVAVLLHVQSCRQISSLSRGPSPADKS